MWSQILSPAVIQTNKLLNVKATRSLKQVSNKLIHDENVHKNCLDFKATHAALSKSKSQLVYRKNYFLTPLYDV